VTVGTAPKSNFATRLIVSVAYLALSMHWLRRRWSRSWRDWRNYEDWPPKHGSNP